MECKQIKYKQYLKITKLPKYGDRIDKALFTSRPGKGYYDTVYVWDTAYEIKLTEEELQTYRKERNERDKYMGLQTSHGLSGYDVRAFLKESKEFKNKEIHVLNLDLNKKYIWEGKVVEDVIKVFVEEEARLVTTDTAADKKRIEKEKNKEANLKLLDTIFKENIDEICKKYGLCIREHCIRFKDEQAYRKFMQNILDETIGKALSEIGIKIDTNKANRKYTEYSTLFDLSKAIIEGNK